MKIKSVLIDDNAFIANVLLDQLRENHPEIEVMAMAKNGKEGLEKIKLLKPDLIFLDIEMPDMNGFEMLSQLETISFQTIFITSHSHYAIKAFRFNALDYLVKPIDEKELASAIRKLSNYKVKSSYQNKIEKALENLKAESVSDQTLFLQTQNGMIRLPLKRIVKIEGNRNYSYIYLSDNTKLLSSKTLGFFEEILSDKLFFRCHRSYLVNGAFINGIKKTVHFLLKNDTEVPISRRKKSAAKSWLKNLIS
ncbi:MAG: LytTR family DNA-binding domain-containing protein [Aequorivita antarctica]